MPTHAFRISLAGGWVLGMGLVVGTSALAQEAAIVQEPGAVEGSVLGNYPYHQRHAVFKPALPIPTRRPQQEMGYEFPTKPLFLKGYSGHLYGRGPREAFIPTGCGVGTIEPVGIGAPRHLGPRWAFWNR
ncbi:MAG TPA: hypothetical protein VGY53_04430 [Isosphaeraceae bacterium]|nr:hypothetical protein [Isosphaeraceae bacterium]